MAEPVLSRRGAAVVAAWLMIHVALLCAPLRCAASPDAETAIPIAEGLIEAQAPRDLGEKQVGETFEVPVHLISHRKITRREARVYGTAQVILSQIGTLGAGVAFSAVGAVRPEGDSWRPLEISTPFEEEATLIGTFLCVAPGEGVISPRLSVRGHLARQEALGFSARPPEGAAGESTPTVESFTQPVAVPPVRVWCVGSFFSELELETACGGVVRLWGRTSRPIKFLQSFLWRVRPMPDGEAQEVRVRYDKSTGRFQAQLALPPGEYESTLIAPLDFSGGVRRVTWLGMFDSTEERVQVDWRTFVIEPCSGADDTSRNTGTSQHPEPVVEGWLRMPEWGQPDTSRSPPGTDSSGAPPTPPPTPPETGSRPPTGPDSTGTPPTPPPQPPETGPRPPPTGPDSTGTPPSRPETGPRPPPTGPDSTGTPPAPPPTDTTDKPPTTGVRDHVPQAQFCCERCPGTADHRMYFPLPPDTDCLPGDVRREDLAYPQCPGNYFTDQPGPPTYGPACCAKKTAQLLYDSTKGGGVNSEVGMVLRAACEDDPCAGQVKPTPGAPLRLEASLLSRGTDVHGRNWVPENPTLKVGKERLKPCATEPFYVTKEATTNPAPAIFAAISADYADDAKTAEASRGKSCSASQSGSAHPGKQKDSHQERAVKAAALGLLASQAKGQIEGLRATFDVTGKEDQLRDAKVQATVINEVTQQKVQLNLPVRFESGEASEP